MDGCVILETSLGDLTIDLYTEACPRTTKNFLWLCKMKYYNDVLFHRVQPDFIAQTGDPEGTGRGGVSAYGQLYGEQAKFFEHEIVKNHKHTKKGIVAMASGGKDANASQFYIQITNRHLEDLDGKHTIFGEVSEGLDVLDKIAGAHLDKKTGRPLRNIRIRHTEIIENPFPDPKLENYRFPSRSPSPRRNKDDVEALEEDEGFSEDERTQQEIEDEEKMERAKYSTKLLTAVGDLPHEDVKPPDNVLFVCKLNKETTDEDLDTIFSQFGNIIKAEVIRDWKTGESLNYAFIEYETEEQCKRAYLKMDNVQIDDRRIKVDFSQSVAKMWGRYKKGDRSMLHAWSKDYKPQQAREQAGRRGRRGETDRKPTYGSGLNFQSTGKLDPDSKPPGVKREPGIKKEPRVKKEPSRREESSNKRHKRHRSHSPMDTSRDDSRRERRKRERSRSAKREHKHHRRRSPVRSRRPTDDRRRTDDRRDRDRRRHRR